MQSTPPLLHHIAIGTLHIELMKEFYMQLPRMEVQLEQRAEDGKIKSVWFEISNGILLMLERKEKPKAPEAMIFSLEGLDAEDYQKIPPIFEKTKYSIYFLDPDGNKIGYSSYPRELSYPFHLSCL
jgi:hypothetical protein